MKYCKCLIAIFLTSLCLFSCEEKDFDVPPYEPLPEMGDGSQEKPYNVDQVVAKGKNVTETGQWVKGYIVGCVDGISIFENSDFETPFNSESNILIAYDVNETDPNKCVPIQLSSGTPARTDLNLKGHPENKGKILLIQGDLNAYFGVAGIKNITSYSLDGKSPDPGPDPGTITGDGSENNPYNVAGIKANQGAANNTNYKWGTGYVVGVYETGVDPFAPSFTAPFTTNSNILIADSPTETDLSNCITVQLPATMRDALSPVNSSTILKKKVSLNGSFEAYFSVPGIKSLQGYKIDGVGPDPDPDPDPSGPFLETFEGTAANKASYVLGDFVGEATTWTVFGVVSSADTNDKKNGTRSVRLRDPNSTNADPHYFMMKNDKANGAGIISLYHGMYGTHTGAATWKLEVSNDGGVTWNAFSQDVTSVPAALTKISFTVNVSGNIRIKITKTNSQSAGSSSINIDDIEITDYIP